MEKIEIYVDGGARGNGQLNSIGAWAYTMEYKGKEKYRYGVETETTNNKQEMRACIEALKSVKGMDIPIEIYSDSAYVVNGIGATAGAGKGWVDSWKNNGWTRGKKKEEIMNLDLWKELDELRHSFDSVTFIKVRGHSGDEGNERADDLVNIAMDEYLKSEIE